MAVISNLKINHELFTLLESNYLFQNFRLILRSLLFFQSLVSAIITLFKDRCSSRQSILRLTPPMRLPLVILSVG